MKLLFVIAAILATAYASAIPAEGQTTPTTVENFEHICNVVEECANYLGTASTKANAAAGEVVLTQMAPVRAFASQTCDKVKNDQTLSQDQWTSFKSTFSQYVLFAETRVLVSPTVLLTVPQSVRTPLITKFRECCNEVERTASIINTQF